MHKEKTKIGIIICHRYHLCAGGKCFRALREREGAFKRLKIRISFWWLLQILDHYP